MGNLFDMSEVKKEAIEKFHERITIQSKLIEEQKRCIFAAIISGLEKVWITKENGGKVEFAIQQAIQGLTTMNLNLSTYLDLYRELTGGIPFPLKERPVRTNLTSSTVTIQEKELQYSKTDLEQ